ncbi:MAG: type II secretion system F family protein [Actinomycetota bacterium]
MVWGTPLALVACAALASWGWYLTRSARVVVEQIAESRRETRPPLVARVVDTLGLRFQRAVVSWHKPRRLARLDTRLQCAGRPEGMTALTFVRRQTGFTVLGAVAGVVFLAAGYPVAAVAVVVFFAAWMDFWLRLVTVRRRAAVAQGLPDFLDILAVTVAAGLGLPAGLERVSAADPSPLGEEIRVVLDDLRYGRSRRQALEGLRERIPIPSVASFVTAMVQAEELGTPIAQALREISIEIRREFAQDARRRAAKAGPKVSLAVTTFIVPGAMLLIVSALVLSNWPAFQELFG